MIDQRTANLVLERALNKGADFCEIFCEDKDELTIGRENGRYKGAAQVHLFGAGIYLLRGTSRVYVYTSDLSEVGLMRLLDRGLGFMQTGTSEMPQSFRERPVVDPINVLEYPGEVSIAKKAAILREIDLAVAATAKAEVQAEYTYFDTDQRVLVAASDGTWAQDRRVTSRVRGRFGISLNGESTGDWTDFTRPQGFECFQNGRHIQTFSQFIRELEEGLMAKPGPRGVLPVVFESGGAVGTFFHEACGHQLETTNMQTKDTYFYRMLGKQVASEKVTLIDDGTLLGQYGSSKYDDEGMPRQQNILIENGILKSALVDRLGSRQFDLPRTGSGRRQNYTFAPAARMSNTYLAPGTDDPDAMIRDIPLGILATKIGGGTGGEEFTLLCPRAFLIKDGKIDRLLRGTMLIGRGDETMMKIDRVSNRLEWEENGAFCGADSGLCNTTTSGARMRVTEMIVG